MSQNSSREPSPARSLSPGHGENAGRVTGGQDQGTLPITPTVPPGMQTFLDSSRFSIRSGLTTTQTQEWGPGPTERGASYTERSSSMAQPRSAHSTPLRSDTFEDYQNDGDYRLDSSLRPPPRQSVIRQEFIPPGPGSQERDISRRRNEDFGASVPPLYPQWMTDERSRSREREPTSGSIDQEGRQLNTSRFNHLEGQATSHRGSTENVFNPSHRASTGNVFNELEGRSTISGGTTPYNRFEYGVQDQSTPRGRNHSGYLREDRSRSIPVRTSTATSGALDLENQEQGQATSHRGSTENVFNPSHRASTENVFNELEGRSTISGGTTPYNRFEYGVQDQSMPRGRNHSGTVTI